MHNPNPTEILVGKNLRKARNAKGLSMAQLEEKADVSAQQISKYETAKNRITAGVLLKFAGILEVPINYFFEEQPENQD